MSHAWTSLSCSASRACPAFTCVTMSSTWVETEARRLEDLLSSFWGLSASTAALMGVTMALMPHFSACRWICRHIQGSVAAPFCIPTVNCAGLLPGLIRIQTAHLLKLPHHISLLITISVVCVITLKFKGCPITSFKFLGLNFWRSGWLCRTSKVFFREPSAHVSF